VLSADVFARFCRSRGYDTLYVCGTDEYGTATETRALEEGKTPRQLCDHYFAIHDDIYRWFGIAFDHFGRTSTPQQTEIVQSLFKDLDEKGYIKEKTGEQLFCPRCERFLADRYVRGKCPHCGYDGARGDQCEQCGKLLDPTELVEPHCSTCGQTPFAKETSHLYIDLPAIQERYLPWMEAAGSAGHWAKNALQMTRSWIRDGLHERAITRDLKWGIPVPKPGYETKVFYVWFDAPIGYMSITKALADTLAAQGKPSFDWQDWWGGKGSAGSPGAADNVDLFQFIGKDNIPFHTVIFPSTLIGSGRNWTKLFHMSSSEYLNYESGKFSKSAGVGVFGNDAKESGIPADAWRFYIFYNRPEKADFQFAWKDFQEKYNGELIGNLGNLVNRTLAFVKRYYDGVIPSVDGLSAHGEAAALWQSVLAQEAKITELLEWAELKDAFHGIFQVSDTANKAFQAGEPWKKRTSAPDEAAALIGILCYVIKDLAIMLQPYLPHYARRVARFFGKTLAEGAYGQSADAAALSWANLGETGGLEKVVESEIIFTPLDATAIDAYRERYAGTQKDRADAARTAAAGKASSGDAPTSAAAKAQGEGALKPAAKASSGGAPKPAAPDAPAKPALSPAEQAAHFDAHIALKAAKILRVEKHPDADKLYVETLDDGSGSERVILSGMAPYMPPEALLGKTIVLADNLKPRKMRGLTSYGMLLASDYLDGGGKESVEVLDIPWAAPGTPVVLEGSAPDNKAKDAEIDADCFFAVDIRVENRRVCIGGRQLTADGKGITTGHTVNGGVH
ncbi:MAG: methionine--tRNA ligase, partial [Spirochaetaceae bacterium]|nr:methionine--tRNA ligase [Spirochaetaceae bacterium]